VRWYLAQVPSVVERALGSDFARLHPQIQKQYGLKSADHLACFGRGIMEEIWRGGALVVPFLWIGSMRKVMFCETGHDVPFTVENYAYLDGFGRETLTWTRTFLFDTPRRFDETVIYSERRDRPVVYAGTHQHLAVDLELSVDSAGAFCLRTGAQRLYEWPIGIRFPMLFSGRAAVRESFCDERQRFEVEVDIRSPVWGQIFGYRGWFKLEWRRCRPGEIPASVKPVREERRE
jgi:hypothetical protein